MVLRSPSSSLMRGSHPSLSFASEMSGLRRCGSSTGSPSQVMREAVEDHRASASHAPRSIYGKIVAEADRDMSPETVIRRTIQFGLSHEPDKGREEQWQRFMQHMDAKYSIHGYIKLWLPGSSNEEKLKELRELIAHPDQMKVVFNRIYDEERG